MCVDIHGPQRIRPVHLIKIKWAEPIYAPQSLNTFPCQLNTVAYISIGMKLA